MTLTYDRKTGERVSKEQIRAIVINEGKWEGMSEEWRNNFYFEFTILRNENNYEVGVKILEWDTILESRNLPSFDSAFYLLGILESAAFRAVEK